MKRKIILRGITILIALDVYCLSFAQSKMVMTVDNKQCDILGYTLNSSPGSSKEIDIFGPIQNATTVFSEAFASSDPIPEVELDISDQNSGETTIKLSQVTVKEMQEYVSDYSNGMFIVASGGTPNTEVKCQYEKIEIISNSSGNKNDLQKTDVLMNNPLSSNISEDKWQIKAADIKGVNGKVSVSLPDDVKQEIKVYSSADNKYLGTFEKKKTILLFPGNYNVSISNAPIEKVPVQKAMDTRLKAGILNLTSTANYQVYDSSKKYLGTFKGPVKVGLPVGNFQLSLNNKFVPVTIKDREIIDF